MSLEMAERMSCPGCTCAHMLNMSLITQSLQGVAGHVQAAATSKLLPVQVGICRLCIAEGQAGVSRDIPPNHRAAAAGVRSLAASKRH